MTLVNIFDSGRAITTEEVGDLIEAIRVLSARASISKSPFTSEVKPGEGAAIEPKATSLGAFPLCDKTTALIEEDPISTPTT